MINKRKRSEVFIEQMVTSREHLYRAIMKARTIVDTESERRLIDSLWSSILNYEDTIIDIVNATAKKEKEKNVQP